MLWLLSTKLKFNWQLDRRSWLNYDSGHHLHNKKTLRMNDINKPQITRVIRSVIFQIDFHDFLLLVFSANSKCEKLMIWRGNWSNKRAWPGDQGPLPPSKTRVWKGVDEADKGTPKSGRSVTINSNYKERLFKWNRIWGWTKWAAKFYPYVVNT